MAVDAALTLEELERLLPPEMFREMGFGGGRNTQQKAAAALRRPGVGGPPRDLEQMDGIGYQLASFGLRGRSFSSIFHPPPSLTPALNVSPHSEMANRTVVRLSPPEMAIRYREPQPPPRGTGAYIPFPKPFHPVQTPAQMSGYGMGRGGGAVHRLPPPPPPAAAAAVRFAGPVRSVGRESGTGVFLPRVAIAVDSARKTGGPYGRWEQQKQPGTDSRRKQGAAAMRTPETPELGLPHEWTY